MAGAGEFFINSHDVGYQNLFLNVMVELKAQQRLTVTHAQFFNHDRGLKTNGVDIFRSTYDFGRTMSTTMRLAMLHCSGVPREFWNEHLSDPVIVNRFPGVVEDYAQGGLFQLATNEVEGLCVC